MVSQVQSLPTVPKELIGAPIENWNPTLLMFLASLAIAGTSVLSYWLWGLPGWACFVLNTFALHMLGTVVHDACHGVGHRNRILNAIMGHISGFLLATTFPVFTRAHMQHHAHVNDPDNDPDHYVSTGGPLLFIPVRFFYHEVFFAKRRLWIKNELFEWLLTRFLLGSIVFWAIQRDGFDPAGAFSFIMTYWLLPAMVIGWALGLFFDYLPHRPFGERDRWRNARVYGGSLMNILILGQNYHLIHHLWPTIPWYRYQPAYRAVKPLLDEKNCHQSLGLLENAHSFWGFVYDIFLGIRWHGHDHPQNQESAELIPPS